MQRITIAISPAARAARRIDMALTPEAARRAAVRYLVRQVDPRRGAAGGVDAALGRFATVQKHLRRRNAPARAAAAAFATAMPARAAGLGRVYADAAVDSRRTKVLAVVIGVGLGVAAGLAVLGATAFSYGTLAVPAGLAAAAALQVGFAGGGITWLAASLTRRHAGRRARAAANVAVLAAGPRLPISGRSA